MAKLAIDRASIVPRKKIGRFSFQIGRSGDFHYFIKIGRSPTKSGDLEALQVASAITTLLLLPFNSIQNSLFSAQHIQHNLFAHDMLKREFLNAISKFLLLIFNILCIRLSVCYLSTVYYYF